MLPGTITADLQSRYCFNNRTDGKVVPLGEPLFGQQNGFLRLSVLRTARKISITVLPIAYVQLREPQSGTLGMTKMLIWQASETFGS